MTIKTISVILDISPKRPASAFAIDLALRLGAKLTGIAAIFDPIVPSYAASPMPADFIVAAREDAIGKAQSVAKSFSDKAAAASFPVETRVVDVIAGGYFESMLGYSRLSDLVVIGQDDPDEPEPARVPAIEAALFRSGAPVLVVPRDGATSFASGNAAIAWDGSGPAARAIRGALPLLAQSTSVEVVMVGDEGKAPDGLQPDVIAYLQAHGVSAQMKHISRGSGNIADALIRHAAGNRVDWLVMGGYGHSRLREFVMGGTTRHMLDQAPMPVLMAH